MSNLPLLKIVNLMRGASMIDSFRDELAVGEFSGQCMPDVREGEASPFAPMRLDALLMLLVEEGSADILIDYAPFKVVAQSFVTLMPTHVIQIVRMDECFKGKMLIVSRDFLDRFQTGMKNRSVANYMEARKNPITPLCKVEVDVILQGIERVREKVKVKGHYYQKEALQTAVVALCIDLANIFVHHRGTFSTPSLSRKEELFEQFLQLLRTHCREHHGVAFYASQLCISPQYLSMLLREQTGKSANKWIDDAVLMEAKMLLKTPQLSVQQVAEQLHFSDQSTFGKFFKKHIGQSPLEFRRS
ncbi:MAG: helix-turn-helix domain-containing protein [Parabacteroides sp.]